MSSEFVWDLSDCFDQKRLTEYVAKCMSSEFEKAMREKHEDNGRGYFDRYDFIMGEIAEKYISSIDKKFGEDFNIKVQEALLDQLKNIDNCYRPINVMQLWRSSQIISIEITTRFKRILKNNSMQQSGVK